MKTVNRVTLLGNLGRDVEMRFTSSGEPVANCQLATSTEWKDRESGERQSATEWHRVVAFGKVAELIGQFCHKGSSVFFEGKLRTRKWADKDGAEQYSTEIVVDDFINLDKVAEQAREVGAAPVTFKPRAKRSAPTDSRPANV